MKRLILAVVGFFSFFPAAFAQLIHLESITIQKQFPRYLQTMSSSTISDMPINSVEEILAYSSGVDLKKRGSFGIQQDVSIRGSTFEDTVIDLNGITLNDPQTGHFNLELPLTSADVERVEIHNNSQRVNFKTRLPQESGGLVKASYGEHALSEALLSVNVPVKSSQNRISFERKQSKGDRTDTDFDLYTISLNSLYKTDDQHIEVLAASTKRDFGANGFYSSSFPHEEEHITQRFFLIQTIAEKDAFQWNNSVYLRRHTDKFILERHNPAFYTNYHTTYAYGLQTNLEFYSDWRLTAFFDRDTITSTNLDRHKRFNTGAALGFKQWQLNKFLVSFQAGLTYYQDGEYVEDIEANLIYMLRDDFNLGLSFDRIWRMPSFTELYYVSPSNRGNIDLDPQKSNNLELGFQWLPADNTEITGAFFYRDQFDTIDWVRNSAASPWQAENIGDVSVYGADLFSKIDFDDSIVRDVFFGYTYQRLNKENPYVFSKYVFDYNRDKIVAGVVCRQAGFDVTFIYNLCNPVSRSSFMTFDCKLEKKFCDFIVSVEGTNIFNEDFELLADIPAAGKWWKASVTYEF